MHDHIIITIINIPWPNVDYFGLATQYLAVIYVYTKINSENIHVEIIAIQYVHKNFYIINIILALQILWNSFAQH